MDHGYDRFAFSSMPIAGANAPVTAAGCAVMGLAELLGGRLVALFINPEKPLIGSLISGTMDMSSGKPSFCSPQAIIQDILIWSVFQRLYGVDHGVERKASYVNAKVPGLQCAYERTFKQMTLASATGRLGLHLGSLDGAAIFSPEQAMIDLDLSRGLWEFFRGVPLDEDSLALDLIDRVGIGEGRSYLDTEHTFEHYREALWMPQLLDVSMWRDGQEAGREGRMLERAGQKWRALVEAWEQPEVDADLLAGVHRIVERAKRDFGL